MIGQQTTIVFPKQHLVLDSSITVHVNTNSNGQVDFLIIHPPFNVFNVFAKLSWFC